jgi:peptide/nickel transport system substrate-binding protein
MMSAVKVALAALAGLLLAGIQAGIAQTPKRGGILNFAVVGEMPNYDCHASTTFALVHPIAPHYSTLLRFSGPHYPRIEGDAAESWDVSKDGLTYTFKLHKGITFHDGSPLTSADVKATYDRIRNPPEGVVSARQAYYADIDAIETPDPDTVVIKLKAPNASMLQSFASPWDCIYKADKLAENPKYPETEILGSGPFTFVKHEKGSSWEGKRFERYFKAGLPYLDGYKAFFVKSTVVVPGLLGGQFDIEFRGRNPAERDQLMREAGDRMVALEGYWVNNLMLVFNTQRKPFDDIRVRQALSMAIDRWGGSAALSKISIMKHVGGVMRPGYTMALPEADLVKLPGFWKDIGKSRAEAKRLLEQAGVKNLKFTLLNRNIPEPYTPGGVYSVDQWRRIGVTAEHEQLETKAYQSKVSAGDFDVAVEFMADYMDDPTAQFAKFLTKKASPIGYSGHTDTKLDDWYEQQRRLLDPLARTKLVNEMDKYALTTAYNVPLLWWNRIVVHHKKVKGWYLTPSHYLWQNLSEVWLDQ